MGSDVMKPDTPDDRPIMRPQIGDRVRTKEGTMGTVAHFTRNYIIVLGDEAWYGEYKQSELEIIERFENREGYHA